MAKREVKVPRNLQLRDLFYIVKSGQLDDQHLYNAKSPLKYFSVEENKVTSVEEDERDESLVIINKKFVVPALGKQGNYKVDEDIISDRTEAFEFAIGLAEVEEEKAKEILDTAQKELQAVKDFSKILKDKLDGRAVKMQFEIKEPE